MDQKGGTERQNQMTQKQNPRQNTDQEQNRAGQNQSEQSPTDKR